MRTPRVGDVYYRVDSDRFKLLSDMDARDIDYVINNLRKQIKSCEDQIQELQTFKRKRNR